MKVLICVNDLLVDEPGIVFGWKLAQDLQAEITLLHVLLKKKHPGDRDKGELLLKKCQPYIGRFPYQYESPARQCCKADYQRNR